MNIFDAAFRYLLENESRSYINDSEDSGGPTKFGVTIQAYSNFMGRKLNPEDIENLTEEQAMTFYLVRYWYPLCCPKIHDSGIAIAIFDSGALYGAVTTAQMVQKAVNICGGALEIDGMIGFETTSSLNMIGSYQFIPAFNKIVLDHISSLIVKNSKNKKYRDGWIHRANRLLTLVSNPLLNREDT